MWPFLKCFQGCQQRRQQSVKVRVTEHRITHRWFFATPPPGSALPLEHGPQCSSPPSSPYTRTYLDNVPQKYVLVSCVCVSQFSSVSQSCPTLCNPKDCSTPGFPVHQQIPICSDSYPSSWWCHPTHLILCCPLLLLPSIFPSIRVFSNESVFHIRWPKYCSFSFQWIFRTDFL